jgi:hypothetical protein
VVVEAAADRGFVYQLFEPLLQLAQPFQRSLISSLGLERLKYFLQALTAPACYVNVEDLLAVVQQAGATCNATLLQELRTAFPAFRWPAAELESLLEKLAGGTEGYHVATLQLLLQLVQGEGFDTEQLAKAVQAAAVSRAAAPRLMTSITRPCVSCWLALAG